MITNGYTLCEQEEKKVLEILERFKENFPDCILLERGGIFGIKEISSYYMCYFVCADGKLYVKFKCDSRKEVFDLGKSYEDKIAKTVEIFKQIAIPAKATNEEKSVIASERSQYAMERFEVMNACKNILDKLGDKCDDVPFDERIMPNAKERLNQNETYTVGDLKKYSLEEIYLKKILTKRCWYQLRSFLLSLAGEPIVDYTTRHRSTLSEELEEKAEYIKRANMASKEFYVEDAYELSLENKEIFAAFYDEFLAFLIKSANEKLDNRHRDILFERIGINSYCKTFQEIGDKHQLSKQGALDATEKAQKRLASLTPWSKANIALNYERFKLIERIQSVSLSGFLAYVCFEHNPYMAHTMGRIIYGANANVKEFVDMVFTQRAKCKEDARNQERAKAFNEYIYEHIKYKNIRTITQEDFDRLNDGRDDTREEVKVFGYDERVFECRSEAEIKILERLLDCAIFADIKLHAVMISLSNDEKYYPSFACLTDEKHFVIVDVADKAKGSANCRKEYLALRKYCERYGFGYLVLNKDAKSCF